MPLTECQKRAQKKWVEKNKEKYAEQQKRLGLQYYYEHREELLAKKKIYYQNKKAQKQQQQDIQENE